jgi:hypothetical protein
MPVPQRCELCVAATRPAAPVRLDESLRELGLARLRRSRQKGSADGLEQTSSYASTLLPDNRRGYWIDLHAEDPDFLGEVTELLAEEGWQVVPCPAATERPPGSPSEAPESAEALSG